jgi:3-oxoacyl-[acyl-carrier-protein] synthase-1
MADGSRALRLGPLPITGYSVLSALGGTREEHLDALAHGRSGLGPAPFALPFTTAVGAVRCELPELTGALTPWATRMARMLAHLVQQLDEPLRRARARWQPDRIGVLLGTSTAGAESTERAYREFVQVGRFPGGYDFLKQHTFGAALHVVAELTGARGPAWMVSTACTSGAKPIASAWRLIHAGVIDAAIVGGADTLCAMTLHGFESLQALDRDRCRPFHRDRLGISIGEGGALLLIERTGDGRVRIESVGETSDAYHVSAPHPDGAGAEAAMRQALTLAGMRATFGRRLCQRARDWHQAERLGRGQGDCPSVRAPLPVVSTKCYTGHTLAAAGAIEAVFSAMAIEEGWIPPALVQRTARPRCVVARADCAHPWAIPARAEQLVRVRRQQCQRAARSRMRFPGVTILGVGMWQPTYPTARAFVLGQADPVAQKPVGHALDRVNRRRAGQLGRALADAASEAIAMAGVDPATCRRS